MPRGTGAFDALVEDELARFDIATLEDAAIGQDVMMPRVDDTAADALLDARLKPEAVFFGDIAAAAAFHREG